MGNTTGRQLSLAEQGRRPNDTEMLVLYKMQRALFQRLVASPEHLQLLQRYWTASFRRKHQMPGFVLISDLWKEVGFSASNPAIDLNPTGELGLQCLVFFVEKYPAEAAMMRRGRGGYPFAKAAIALVRALSVTVHLMDATHTPGPFPVTTTLYWQLFQHETDFFQLFSLAFLAFEESFCEEVAVKLWIKDLDACSMAIVDKLVAAVELRLTTALIQAPLALADLQDLCSNGRYIIENTHAAPMDEQALTDCESGSVSRWVQHHRTERKSMRDIGKTWGKETMDESVGRNVYRLKPRMPEIERFRSDNLPVMSDAETASGSSSMVESESNEVCAQMTQDLFAGLTTKHTMSLTDSKNNEHGKSRELAAPIA